MAVWREGFEVHEQTVSINAHAHAASGANEGREAPQNATSSFNRALNFREWGKPQALLRARIVSQRFAFGVFLPARAALFVRRSRKIACSVNQAPGRRA